MELTGRTVLVTGASGFTGGHLTTRLAEEGARVRALVRGSSHTNHLTHPAIELYYGDVTEPETLRPAVDGAEVVFHLAAKVGHWGPDDEFDRVNVQGTRNLLEAACTAGVGRFVHASTVGVYGLDPVDGTDETAPYARSASGYCNSKIDAEELVFGFWRERGLPVAVIRPAEIYGPRAMMTTVGPVLAARMGWLELVDGGEGICNHVYVGNLVEGFVLAAQAGEAVGQGYIISDGVGTPYREFMGYYARMAGRDALPSVSKSTALARAEAMERKAATSGKPPPTTQVAVAFLTQRATFSIEKAKRELEYEPRVSLEEGMRVTEAWLREAGYLQ
jgi:nucleoside-diphosphate-sugar epimerase